MQTRGHPGPDRRAVPGRGRSRAPPRSRWRATYEAASTPPPHMERLPGERRAASGRYTRVWPRSVRYSHPGPRHAGNSRRRISLRSARRNGEKVMKRIVLGAVLGVTLAAGGLALAQHAYRGPEQVRTLSERDILESLDGKPARVTTTEVTFAPGQAGLPHRHAGPIFGYVLEGEFELALDDEPPKTLKAGETFYEQSGVVHRVARNPSSKTKTRVLAVNLHPRDAKGLTLPADE